MAVYKVKNKKKVPKNFRKIMGIVLLVLSCVFLFCMITNIIPFMHSFLLGTFGIFGYPLFCLMFLIGIALINNKSYRQSKVYTTFMILSVIFALCLIQMGVIGGPEQGETTLSFGQHLALSYTKKLTAGGILIGLLTTSLTYTVGYVWAYVIFGVLFAVSLAVYIDCLVFMIKRKKKGEPVKISLRNIKGAKEEVSAPVKEEKKEEPVKEEERPLSARERLGLVKRAPSTYEKKLPKVEEPAEEKPQEKRSILTPPEIDFEKFFNSRKESPAKITPSESEINRNISSLKEETISPEPVIHSESFSISRQPRTRGNLPELKPEQVVSEVDDIIQQVVQESGVEVNQNGDKPSDRDLNRDRDLSRDRDISRDSNLSRDRDLDLSCDRNLTRDRDMTRGQDMARNGNDRGYNNELTRDRERRFVDIDNLDTKVEPEEEVKPYVYSKPPIDLITTQSTDMSDLDEGVANKTILLENTLQEFGVAAKVQDVVIGPAVTRYELEMPSGVTVKKILNLSSDIALTLEANGGDVRIEAPVPGRSVVGVEVPNDRVATVSLKDVLSSQEFKNAKSPLTYAVGKDITGNIILGDLSKAPHLLIAGTTGSGKSVMLNGIILSLLYKSSPEDVRLMLIDPKQVEFKMYEGIPHLLTPRVLTDVVKAGNALQWAVDEMERRFRLISDACVKDIGEYNRMEAVLTGKKKKMPYIVLIIDEFSDFMMTSKKDVEDRIVRLGQKARAAGIHMILATQRPTTECVTGGIKANFPSRIAFKVAGRVNSDVILGMTGAEKLLGRGDMLYAPIEYSAAPKRVQGCFITTEEISNIVNYVSLNNEQDFDPAIQDAINNVDRGNSGGEDKTMDPLLPEALKICIDSNQASGSMIQRRLSIGYPRAGKIIDQMTQYGYISAADGAKPRKVYITLEEYYKIFGDQYD